MATITVRKLDESVHRRLQDRARINNRSLEAEIRLILEEQANNQHDVVRELDAFRREMIAKHGPLPDSTEMMRELRREQ